MTRQVVVGLFATLGTAENARNRRRGPELRQAASPSVGAEPPTQPQRFRGLAAAPSGSAEE